MAVNPRSLKNLVNLPRLESDVTSEVHRVRASAEVQAWFRAISAEQRGELLTTVMVGAPAEAGVAGAGVGRQARRSSKGPSRGLQSLEGVTLLKVAAVVLPSRLKNSLRWSPQRYTDLEAVLQSTEQVRLVRDNSKEVWRVDSGDYMRRDTVSRLVGAGVLVAD